MRSIIENIKEIEEENLKEVISLTNENDELKRRIAGLKKDIEGTEAAVEDSYNRGFFDAITKIKDVISKTLYCFTNKYMREELYNQYYDYIEDEHIEDTDHNVIDEALAKKFGVTKEFAHEVMNFYYYPQIYYIGSTELYE